MLNGTENNPFLFVFIGFTLFFLIRFIANRQINRHITEIYIHGYLNGFRDCSQKNLEFLKKLPNDLKKKFEVEIEE